MKWVDRSRIIRWHIDILCRNAYSEWRGSNLRKGEYAMLMIAAANLPAPLR
jgi:hypothetical protein